MFQDQAADSVDVGISEAVNLLCERGLINLLEDYFFEEVQCDLRQRVAPRFWQYFGVSVHTQADNSTCNAEQLFQAIDYLHKVAQEYQPCVQVVEKLPREINRYKKIIKML